MRYSWMQIMLTLYILASLSAIIVLSVALGHCNSKLHNNGESFCSCHGVQYDGSAGNPDTPIYPGTFCTNKNAVKKAYREGKIRPGI